MGMGSANKRRRYNVTSSLIGWAHTQNDPWNYIYEDHCLVYALWYHFCEENMVNPALYGSSLNGGLLLFLFAIYLLFVFRGCR